ncbi:WYL domain-containing protein [Candidatus Dependentiae bacterium]|nr:WYL domain-containing protein [Candidatus Dependentiae bacterium]
MNQRPIIYRLYRLIGLFKEKNKRKLNELAEILEYHPKTIKRDIEQLNYDFRIKIYYDNKSNYWKIDKSTINCSLPLIGLSEEDYKSLLLGYEILDFVKPYPKEKSIIRVIEVIENKIREISGNERIQFISLDNGTTVLANDEEKVRNFIKYIESAITQKIKVKFDYYSPKKNKEDQRLVWPLILHNNCGRWFLLAFDQRKKELRLFCLDRMNNFKALEENFVYNEKEFNQLVDYCRKSFRNQLEKRYRVKIKFDDYQARWLKKQHWFESQEIKDLKNGEIEFRFDFSGVEDFKRWFLKYGKHAEVLSPKWLRHEIKKELEETLLKYKRG